MSELNFIKNQVTKIKLSSHDPNIGGYCDSIINMIDTIESRKVVDENLTLLKEKILELDKFVLSFGDSVEIHYARQRLVEVFMWVEKFIGDKK